MNFLGGGGDLFRSWFSDSLANNICLCNVLIFVAFGNNKCTRIRLQTLPGCTPKKRWHHRPLINCVNYHRMIVLLRTLLCWMIVGLQSEVHQSAHVAMFITVLGTKLGPDRNSQGEFGIHMCISAHNNKTTRKITRSDCFLCVSFVHFSLVIVCLGPLCCIDHG